MITLKVEEYCHNCRDFVPSMHESIPRILTMHYTNGDETEIVSDITIRCEHEYKCNVIRKHLESKVINND